MIVCDLKVDIIKNLNIPKLVDKIERAPSRLRQSPEYASLQYTTAEASYDCLSCKSATTNSYLF